jgi:hypothetical protein
MQALIKDNKTHTVCECFVKTHKTSLFKTQCLHGRHRLFFITLKGEALQRRAGVGGQVKKKKAGACMVGTDHAGAFFL